MAKKVQSKVFQDPKSLKQLERLTGDKWKFDSTKGLTRVKGKGGKRRRRQRAREAFGESIGATAATGGDKRRIIQDAFDKAVDKKGRPLTGAEKRKIRERVKTKPQLTRSQQGDFNQQFRQGESARQEENTLFNTEANQNINDFLQNPLALSEGEQGGLDLSGGVPGTVDASEQFFGDFTAPAAQELVETGMPVDTQALHEAALRGFTRETLPAALERLVGGAGLASSGAVDQLGGLARDLSAQLAGLDFGAAENAAARRAGSLSTVSDLFTRQIGNRGNAAAGLFDLGQAGRLGEESTRGGGRLFGAENILSGNAGGAAPLVQGYQPESQSLGTFGKIASGIQGVSKAFSPF